MPDASQNTARVIAHYYRILRTHRIGTASPDVARYLHINTTSHHIEVGRDKMDDLTIMVGCWLALVVIGTGFLARALWIVWEERRYQRRFR